MCIKLLLLLLLLKVLNNKTWVSLHYITTWVTKYKKKSQSIIYKTRIKKMRKLTKPRKHDLSHYGET